MDPAEQQRRDALVGFTDGRRVVIAGPGAGKTRLLVERLVALLEAGAAPRSLLTLVFNRRAAGELRRRLAAELPDRGLVELRVATFHSFALSVCDRFWRQTPLSGRPALLPTPEQRAVVRALLAATPDPDGWTVPDAVRRSASFGRHVADGLLRLQEHGDGGDDPQARLGADDVALRACLVRYQQLLAGRSRLDHAGVLATAADLAGDPAVRAALGVEHLLVDEYQDVNPAQERLVAHLASGARSVVVVGDPDQAIYGFRGATPAALARASAHLGAREVRLTTGFRCAQPVVDAARSLVAGAPLTGRAAGGGVAAAAFAHRSDELQWMAEHVRRLGLTTPWSEIAVLTRSLRTLRGPVTRALTGAGIPVRVTGQAGRAGADDPWVATLLDLLGLATRDAGPGAGAGAEVADVLDAAAVSPLVGADPLGLRQPLRAARRSDDPEAVLRRWALDHDDDVAALLEGLAAARRAAAGGADVATVAWALWHELPVRARLDERAGAGAALDAGELAGARAVQHWFAALDRFVDRNPTGATLADHLATLDADDVDDLWTVDRDDTDEGVQVLTIHQAKGLEFDHVVVPALEEGRFPVVGRASALGGTPADAAAEERRLLYVALTRARHTVALTATVGADDRVEASPSRFFSDLADHLLDPTDLLDPPPADPLLDVATVAGARRAWGRVLRDPTAGDDDRRLAARGLQVLLGTPTRLPWVHEPTLEPSRRLRTTPWVLSASAIETYLGCGRKFLYERVLRLAPWQAHPSGAFGTAVHEGIGGWLRAGEAPDKDALRRRLDDAFRELAEPAMPHSVQRESFRRKLAGIVDHVVDDLLPGLGPIVDIEADLTVDGPHGTRLLARPDVVTGHPGGEGLEVVDWKTKPAKRQDAADDVQLTVYHHVTHVALGRPVQRLRRAHVTTGRWSEQRVGDDHDARAAALIESVAAALAEERFDVGDDPPCRYCAATALCDRRAPGQDLPW
jgi:superfamily I DNA/RNA helicase